MVFKDGRLLMSYGVMGGDIQAQGHAQVLINLIDRGLNLQQAIDAPRVRYISGRGVMMEDTLPPSVIAALVARGHERVLPPAGIMHRALMGGGQAIMIDPTNGRAPRRVRHPQGRTRHWLLDASPLPLLSSPPRVCALWGSSSRLDARVDPADTKLLTQPAVSASQLAFIYAGDLFVADLGPVRWATSAG